MFGTVRVRLVVSITVIWLPNELRFARENECVWMVVVFAPLVFDDACNEPQATSLFISVSPFSYCLRLRSITMSRQEMTQKLPEEVGVMCHVGHRPSQPFCFTSPPKLLSVVARHPVGCGDS